MLLLGWGCISYLPIFSGLLVLITSIEKAEKETEKTEGDRPSILWQVIALGSDGQRNDGGGEHGGNEENRRIRRSLSVGRLLVGRSTTFLAIANEKR